MGVPVPAVATVVDASKFHAASVTGTPERVGVGVVVGVAVDDGEGVVDAVAVVVATAVPVAVPVVVTVAPDDSVADGDGVDDAVSDAEPVCDGVIVPVGVRDGVPLRVGVTDGVGVADGDTGDRTMPRYSAPRPAPADGAETSGALYAIHAPPPRSKPYTPFDAVTYAVVLSVDSDTPPYSDSPETVYGPPTPHVEPESV